MSMQLINVYFSIYLYMQAKLIGSSQSSIELVRHLHNLLVEDGKLSPGAAKSRDVTTLIARYDTLIAQARAREQLIRELR